MKTLMTFSLDLEVCRALADYSLEHGQTPSGQVNELLRRFLTLSFLPAGGEVTERTPDARCQAAIRKVVRLHRCLPLRELRRKTRPERWGADVWDGALRYLVEAGEVRIGEQETPSGQRRRVVASLL